MLYPMGSKAKAMFAKQLLYSMGSKAKAMLSKQLCCIQRLTRAQMG